MNTPLPTGIEEEARLWAIRLHDPAFDAWDAFTDWLERDPAHLTAYDAEVAAQAEIAQWFATPPAPALAAEPVVPARASRWRWAAGGGAIAAALAGFFGWGAMQSPAGSYSIQTAAGERRAVQLADGSTIRLNGATRITLDRAAPRRVTLVQGQAVFDVRHDADNPFTVTAGDAQLLDMGTRFDVVREGDTLKIGVSEGEVLYNPTRDKLRLVQGQTLRIADGRAERGTAEPAAIGGWQDGQLSYAGAPVRDIASDLTRNLGRPVEAAPGMMGSFTGTLTLQGDPDQVIARAAPLLGVAATPKGKGWILTPSHGAHR